MKTQRQVWKRDLQRGCMGAALLLLGVSMALVCCHHLGAAAPFILLGSILTTIALNVD